MNFLELGNLHVFGKKLHVTKNSKFIVKTDNNDYWYINHKKIINIKLIN